MRLKAFYFLKGNNKNEINDKNRKETTGVAFGLKSKHHPVRSSVLQYLGEDLLNTFKSLKLRNIRYGFEIKTKNDISKSNHLKFYWYLQTRQVTFMKYDRMITNNNASEYHENIKKFYKMSGKCYKHGSKTYCS